MNGQLTAIDVNSGIAKYKPNKDFIGSDMFTYAVDHPVSGLERAFVRINVLGPKGALPRKTNPDFATAEEGKLVAFNVFLNDHFNDADEPKIIKLSKTTYGASQIYDEEEGTVVYAPHQAFNGYEYFTYTAETKDGSKHVEAISIYIEPKPVVLAQVDSKEEDEDEGEVYALSEIDEDRVDVNNRPDMDLESIYFGFDRAGIRSDAKDIMQANIAVLNQNPKAVIEILSHCDSRGPKAYNLILSARRAKATRDYLVANGISTDRIVAAVGVGGDDLVNDCGDGVPCSKADHQLNRRSDFRVVGSLRD